MLVGIGFLHMKAHIATGAGFALSQFLIANYFELKLINVIVSMVTLVNLTIDGGRRPGKDHRIGKVNQRLRPAMPLTVAPSPFTFQCQKADG